MFIAPLLSLAALASPSVEGATDARLALVRAFSAREQSSPCGTLDALTSDPVADLTWVVETVTTPPWVGMRAAECLITQHAEESRALLEIWVTHPEHKGLGWLVLDHLDALPQPMARDLALAAVSRGPDPAGARRRISRSKVPVVQAVGAE